MSLLRAMFGLNEAGIEHGPGSQAPRKRRGFRPAEPEDEVPAEEPEYDPTAEPEPAPEEDPEPEPEERPYERPAPFASKSAPMPKVGPGVRVSGDPGTLGALQEALQEAGALIEGNDDLADWCDQAWKALAQGIRRGEGSVSLPKFESVPEDLEPDEDEEGDY